MDHLVSLYQTCFEELHKLQKNITYYLETSHKAFDLILDHEEAVKDNSPVAVLAYDKFLSSICNMLDLARKFNMHLCLNDHEEETTRTLFQAMDITDRFHVNGIQSKYTTALEQKTKINEEELVQKPILTTIKCDYKKTTIPPAEEFDDHQSTRSCSPDFKENSESISYTRKDLSAYKEGSIIDAAITYLYDLETLQFYIFDRESPDMKHLAELKNAINLRQYTGLPIENEIFGLVIDNSILRAVRESWMNFVPKKDDKHQVLLLDFGEIVDMTTADIAYHLPLKFQKLPAQSILCQLDGISHDDNFTTKELQRALKNLHLQNAKFCVTERKDFFLRVQLLSAAVLNDATSENIDEPCRQSSNPFITEDRNYLGNEEAVPLHALPKNCPNGFTEEDMKILMEEPLNTSNAMIATMGYNPSDERRLCRFYNRKTGACFKGSNCRREHLPMNPEGWTTDHKEVKSFINDNQPLYYDPGIIINITPTHIVGVNKFFAQINDDNSPVLPFIWKDDEVPQWLHLSNPPLLYDVVRARYEDGNWYRAQLIDTDEDRKVYKVFYVDYGNQQTVTLNELALCDRSAVLVPFQAVLCHISDMMANNEATDEIISYGKSTLNDLILNQNIDVKVVSNNEDLVVRLLGERFSKIPKRLIEMGCAKQFYNRKSKP